MEGLHLKQSPALVPVLELPQQHHHEEEELLLSAPWASPQIPMLATAMPTMMMMTMMTRIMSLVSNRGICSQVERSQDWQFRIPQTVIATIPEM